MSVLIVSHAVYTVTGVQILFFKKWNIICLQMMCSSNLAQTHVRDIGL